MLHLSIYLGQRSWGRKQNILTLMLNHRASHNYRSAVRVKSWKTSPPLLPSSPSFFSFSSRTSFSLKANLLQAQILNLPRSNSLK